MSWVAGMDGCKRGWIVVLRETTTGEITIQVADAVSELLRLPQSPDVVCIDSPIGLLDRAVPGGRQCDREARTLLGAPRSGSVFSPPARPVLRAATFEEAVRLNRATSDRAVGISRQCFGILGKVRELDALMSPALQERVREAHPEVSFSELHAGVPLAESKRSAAGLGLRIHLLELAWRRDVGGLVEATRGPGAGRDDITDAMAVCWTAERVRRGIAVRLPLEPPRDSRGLRMEIVR